MTVCRGFPTSITAGGRKESRLNSPEVHSLGMPQLEERRRGRFDALAVPKVCLCESVSFRASRLHVPGTDGADVVVAGTRRSTGPRTAAPTATALEGRPTIAGSMALAVARAIAPRLLATNGQVFYGISNNRP